MPDRRVLPGQLLEASGVAEHAEQRLRALLLRLLGRGRGRLREDDRADKEQEEETPVHGA